MIEKKIAEFAAGDEVQGFYILKQVNIKTSSNHKKYLDLTLADKTGEINAKLWDAKGNEENVFTPGLLVKIRGNVTLWQNALQFKIQKIRLVEDADNMDVADYVPSAPIEAETMHKELLSYIEKIQHNDIRGIVQIIFDEYKDALMTAPAAKSNHHAVRSGLMYHLLRMLRSAESMAAIYPNLNADLLYAGVLLHDIEKINEMDADDMGVVSAYSFGGQLLGHIIMGIKKISEVGKSIDADPEIVVLLEHMVLSHHYEPEFGSPKKPLIPEAEVLHFLDMIDARVYDMTKVLKQQETGAFSDPVFVLDRRRLYRSSLHTLEEDV